MAATVRADESAVVPSSNGAVVTWSAKELAEVREQLATEIEELNGGDRQGRVRDRVERCHRRCGGRPGGRRSQDI